MHLHHTVPHVKPSHTTRQTISNLILHVKPSRTTRQTIKLDFIASEVLEQLVGQTVDRSALGPCSPWDIDCS